MPTDPEPRCYQCDGLPQTCEHACLYWVSCQSCDVQTRTFNNPEEAWAAWRAIAMLRGAPQPEVDTVPCRCGCGAPIAVGDGSSYPFFNASHAARWALERTKDHIYDAERGEWTTNPQTFARLERELKELERERDRLHDELTVTPRRRDGR